MRKLIPGITVAALATAFSLWAYPHLPAEVATHFDFQGNADGWSSPRVAAAAVPLMILALLGITLVLPKIDPRRANYALFTPSYWAVMNSVMVLLLGIHVVTLGKALGWNINIGRVVPLGVGALLLVMGNLMTRFRPNWFFGIRTPWTLSSDVVWRKTHRFGGAAFMLSGACFVAAAAIDSTKMAYAAFGVTIAAALGSVLYSYLAWRRAQGHTSDTAGATPG
jgi:uncharacterized membrane protein